MGAKQQGATETQGRWLTIPRSLCFVVNGDSVLLMKRAPHKRIFPNQYNGLGGHIERGEDPKTGAIREIQEECGLKVQDAHLVAIHHVDARDSVGILLFVFVAESDSRDIFSDNAEGTLHWIPICDVGSYDLVEDLFFILPKYLEHVGKSPLFAHVSYDEQDLIVMQYAD